MRRRKAILAMTLVLMLLASTGVAHAVGATVDDPYFNVNGKTPEEVTGRFIYWGWDEGEFEAVKNGMMAIYPNIEPEFTNVPYADYLMKVTTAVASGAEAPDVMAMDVVYLGKFFDLGICEDLGSDPWNIDKSLLIDFTAQIATAPDGALRSVPNLAPAGATYYKRDLAIKYFGTDDPAVIGEKISTWDKFIETGKELKEASNGECYMIAGLDSIRQPTLRQITEPWVDQATGQLNTDELFLPNFQLLERIHEAGIAGPYDQDTPAWNAAIGGDDVFCYVGAMYYQFWVISNNDPEGAGNWAVTYSPGDAYTQGGIYWGMYTGAQNKDAAGAYMKYQTSELGSKYKWDYQLYYPPTKASYDEPWINEPAPYFGGQVPTEIYLDVFDKMGANVPACQVEDGLLNETYTFYIKAMAQNQGSAEDLCKAMTDEIISKVPDYHR